MNGAQHMKWLRNNRQAVATDMNRRPIDPSEWMRLHQLWGSFNTLIEQEKARQVEEKSRRTTRTAAAPQLRSRNWTVNPPSINCSLGGADPPWQWTWGDGGFVEFSDMLAIPRFHSYWAEK